MQGYDNKVTMSRPGMKIPTGGRSAVTRTYPKPGMEQSVTKFDPGPDSPGGSAVTFTAPKSGQKQSV